MPTDAVVKSVMTVKQLLNQLSKDVGIARLTDKISERVNLMRREPIEYEIIRSLAYVSYGDSVVPLFRGYPMPVMFNRELMLDVTRKSIDWLVDNMNEDGSFLYYYDPVRDTIIDHEHPRMVDPPYNNILRHSGGIITLLHGYQLAAGDERYLDAAAKGIDFLLSTFREHSYRGEYACYPFFNNKSKLGGAGIGLVALMHYTMKSGSENYRKEIEGLVRHILSRIDSDGEMIGYYIHPKFNGGEPIIEPEDDVKKELFSFYYPGEALLGLALYYHYFSGADEVLRQEVLTQSEAALDFLVDVRPVKYHYLFDVLPADAWLMQAIEEWVKVEALKKKSYIDFVFGDTQKMFDHMYHDKDDCEFDYIGGYYYNYGDHVYHDASRNEGVMAAYHLAQFLGDEARAEKIMKHMLLSAKGLMHTFHSETSTYAHIDPSRVLHSFRFKLTRQWVRVDSVQHTACFFSRLYATSFSPQQVRSALYHENDVDMVYEDPEVGEEPFIRFLTGLQRATVRRRGRRSLSFQSSCQVSRYLN
ncbi:MAG: protein containing Six-hairpin glycosidase-like domain protein [Planctomycetes bacterium]|nr:protein containing Six-hairpin glycosidase-like domain protein [Planctomycetota bacterium]